MNPLKRPDGFIVPQAKLDTLNTLIDGSNCRYALVSSSQFENLDVYVMSGRSNGVLITRGLRKPADLIMAFRSFLSMVAEVRTSEECHMVRHHLSKRIELAIFRAERIAPFGDQMAFIYRYTNEP